VQVRDLVVDWTVGPSSLAASLSTTTELLEGQVDAAAANGVYWGTRSALVTALSQFLELEAELELLGSGHNTTLTEDQVDALWILTHSASDLLALHILPSIVRCPPDGVEE
jgi:hypothetical protein